MARRKRKPPPNPLVRPLAIVGFSTLAIVLPAALFGFDGLLGWAAKPLMLACSLLVAAYTIAAIRLGWIATIDHFGRALHYDRSREPVLFWLLAVLYLGLALPTAYYLGILLLDT